GEDGRRDRPGPGRHPHPARRGPPHAGPVDPLDRDRHPAPHRRPGCADDDLPRHLGVPVDAGHRALRRRDPLSAGELRLDPVPREPGAGDARAVQDAARRGVQHALRARDRGPRDRARRGRRRSAARDGHEDRPRDRRLRPRARHRRPVALAPARGADHRGRRRSRAGREGLPARRAQVTHHRNGAHGAGEPLLDRPRGRQRGRARPGAGEHRASRPPGVTPRLPAAGQGPASARCSRRAARRALRGAAEAPRRQRRRPAGGRRGRGAAGPQRPRGTLAAGRVQHPRALRL
ncbi:MAG: DNA integrity scanning protein DisA, partial [uncultured Nocardioidaceae bacterium]